MDKISGNECISHNKYGSHILNTAHKANILYGHVNPPFLHVYAKTQPTATSTSPVIAKYVQETNMPMKLDILTIYAKIFCMHMWDVCACISHIKHVH